MFCTAQFQYFLKFSCHIADEFNTQVDIELSKWAKQKLPQISVEAGWETLQQEFRKLIESTKMQNDHDDIFDDLKMAVLNEVIRRHKWEEKVNMSFRSFHVLNVSKDPICISFSLIVGFGCVTSTSSEYFS